MLDEVIKGGTVIDGTGAPGRVADVGIRDGRIVAVGQIDEEAAIVTDATGRIVMPGIVDPHTHYDAQLLWDPGATPSANHGVTTVIAGNCGFTLAPLRPDPAEADYLQRMMARVEGMPLAALEHGRLELGDLRGVPGPARGQDRRQRRLPRGPLRHPPLRHGPGVRRQRGHARADRRHGRRAAQGHRGRRPGLVVHQVGHPQRRRRPARRLAAGPPTRSCMALAAETGRHEGTTLEGIVAGCLDRFADDEIELLGDLSAAANRPLNWNVLTVDSREADRVPRQLSAYDSARAKGGRVVALTMPVLVPMNMSFLTFCGIWLLPGWQEALSVPVAERIARLQDPEVRAQLLDRLAVAGGGRVPPPGRLGRVRHRRHLLPRQRGPLEPGREGHRRRARHRAVRHPARHRRRRRAAHGAVAGPEGQDRRRLGACAPRSGTTPGR